MKLFFCKFYLLLFTISVAYGQTKTDSLVSLLPTAKKDSSFIHLSYQIISNIQESNPEKALEIGKNALTVAKEIKDEKSYANLLVKIGWIYYRLDNIEQAFAASQEALVLLDKIGNQQGKADVLINIAAIYNEQQKYEPSLEYFKKALEIQTVLGNKAGMVRCFNNLAYTSLKAQLYTSAQEYVQKSMEVNKEVGNQYYLGFALRTQGDIWYAQKDYPKAIEAWEQGLKIAKAIENRSLTLASLNRIGRCYIDQKEFTRAENLLVESVAIAEKYNLRSELSDAYQLLAMATEALQKPTVALAYQKKFIALHDSLFNESSSKKLAHIEAAFELERKEKEIALLQASVKEDRLIIFSIFGTACMLVIIIGLVLINRNRIKKTLSQLEIASKDIQEKNEEILQQKEEIEQTNEALTQTNNQLEKQSAALKAINATKDKLFAIIGHDLRSPVASLIGLMRLLEYKDIDQEEFLSYTNKLKMSVTSLHSTLDNLLIWANTQMQGITLRKEIFNIADTAQEINDLFAEIAENKKISLSNEVLPSSKVNADLNHTKLIFRNLIGNALKFTRVGGKISIKSDEKGDFLEVQVIDTGLGMSAEMLQKLFTPLVSSTKGTAEEKGTGLGLLLCKDFVERNGGNIWAESEIGKGSTFYFTLPKA
jgi:two-component system, sensor histidine kinase and response regulator